MEIDEFEVYPLYHNGRVYNVITSMDLTFREVRGMIDALAAKGAFSAGGDAQEPGDLFTCEAEGCVFEVDVRGFDVMVYRRDPAK
ncbi:MAG: hypothetical protein WC899_07085 [bacterium]|jgi:hypothetical protein